MLTPQIYFLAQLNVFCVMLMRDDTTLSASIRPQVGTNYSAQVLLTYTSHNDGLVSRLLSLEIFDNILRQFTACFFYRVPIGTIVPTLPNLFVSSKTFVTDPPGSAFFSMPHEGLEAQIYWAIFHPAMALLCALPIKRPAITRPYV